MCNETGCWSTKHTKEEALAHSFLTEIELRRLHPRLGHPLVAQLYKVLNASGHDTEYEVLEELTKVCHQCQLNVGRPTRFKFTLHDEHDSGSLTLLIHSLMATISKSKYLMIGTRLSPRTEYLSLDGVLVLPASSSSGSILKISCEYGADLPRPRGIVISPSDTEYTPAARRPTPSY